MKIENNFLKNPTWDIISLGVLGLSPAAQRVAKEVKMRRGWIFPPFQSMLQFK